MTSDRETDGRDDLTRAVDLPTDTMQLRRILMAGDVAPTVVSVADDADQRVNWRWVVGIAVAVAAIALAASMIAAQSLGPIVRTTGCGLMSNSTSCVATGSAAAK